MEFKPGFRLSTIDTLVIFTSLITACYVHSHSHLMTWVIFFVVAHFFLFCNIMRMSRVPELVWASIFIVFSSLSIQQNFPWLITFSLSFIISFILIFLETKKASYHGVFWKQLNPNLPEWFNNKRNS